MTSPETSSSRRPSGRLVRGLGAWDGALITIGSIVGTGIFITTGDMARALPHSGLILLAWVLGGLLTLAGALTYGELGALFPRAGGIYHFLREAYGPLWGFLYGWTAFLVIMSGGIAAIAVGFGEYLGSFLPFFSTRHVLLSLPLGPWTWSLSGGQLAAVLAIVLLTAINYFGLKEGAWVQNLLTLVKVGSIVLFVALGLTRGGPASADGASRLTSPVGGSLGSGGVLLAAFGVAMIATLWTYDGWYNLTFSAGEMKNPGRSLPLGLIAGTLAVVALYTLLNLVYVRALPVAAMAGTARIGETAAAALFGPRGARLLSAAVLLSSFGCLSSTILCCSRIYHPMAEDGLFFRSLAAVHPRHHTPGRSLWAQSGWAVVLTLSGTYEQLYTYVVFAGVLFHIAAGAAVFVLRRTRPDGPGVSRPYRVWGYPVVPALFILASLVLMLNTLFEKPKESLWGLLFVALGLPAYAWWSRHLPQRPREAAVVPEPM
ncbi:MAG TPA: amino acid permease [Thermoanaerobaculia bacterium]|jgi:APA family basic amino acid/polyamine antiporter|nr:amino acid permease [Thermoanaerobaculia bacterium]